MRINGNSRVLVVIGDPVTHSVSPALYNSAIGALGLNAVYVPLEVEPAALPHVIRACEATGIAGNVTVPHKVSVAGLLIRLTALAKELGAVNTFWSEGGRAVGDNTDVPGILDAVATLDAGGPWLVAGTGGAARAVAAAARERQTTLLVRSRDPGRARDFVDWARDLGLGDVHVDDGRPAALVINATPLGLHPEDPHPVPPDRLTDCGAVLDMVYGRGETAWVRAARKRGLTAMDGRVMLVAQGARAFERFFPDQVAPREVMAAAVARALLA